MNSHGTLVALGTQPLATTHGDFVVHVFQNLITRAPALAVACGDVTTPAPVLARVHSSCVTSESYGGCDCDCAQQLEAALRQIAAAGRGVVFYLMQEGRGAGFLAKARDRMIVQASGHRLSTFEAYAEMGLEPDCRRYDEIGYARRLLGITAPFALLTNNPDKTTGLEAAGVPIAGVRPLRHPASPFNAHYLRAKSRVGHTLPSETAPIATLPEPVARFEPQRLASAPYLVHMASYLLPVAPCSEGDPGPHWFWSHAYLDTTTGRARVVLSYGSASRGPLPVRIQTDTLLERFPMRGDRPQRARWNATVRAFAREGAGCAVFTTLHDLGADATAVSDPDADETTLRLLAHHAAGRRVRPVLAPGAEHAVAALLRDDFARHGVKSDAILPLDAA
jgi:3,4-dihydroxy 2-butanone 4-phosphate synthase/GTP cyclohydrolase II